MPRRRSMLLAAGAATLLPAAAVHAAGSRFQCGAGLRLAVLAPLTGPLAGLPRGFVAGIQQAVSEARAQGCAATMLTYDAGSPQQQIVATMRTASRDAASVVFGAFGAAIAYRAASSAPNALVVDIMQAGSPALARPNLVAVPYGALFFTLDPERREASQRAVGQAAAAVVLETIRTAPPGRVSTPQSLVLAMLGRRFEVPSGPIALDGQSGTFRRV